MHHQKNSKSLDKMLKAGKKEVVSFRFSPETGIFRSEEGPASQLSILHVLKCPIDQ
jgi:hypothetical protein